MRFDIVFPESYGCMFVCFCIARITINITSTIVQNTVLMLSNGV